MPAAASACLLGSFGGGESLCMSCTSSPLSHSLLDPVRVFVCVCVFQTERERERASDRERDRERETERERQRDRESDRDRQTDRETDRQRKRQRKRERESETEMETERETEAETQTHTNGLAENRELPKYIENTFSREHIL